MYKIMLATLFLTATVNANNCDDFKRNAVKYEKMGLSAKNLEMGAEYLKIAIYNKKRSFDVCFYSAFDKPKIEREIKETEEIRRDMLRQVAIQRRHELNVARESADKK